MRANSPKAGPRGSVERSDDLCFHLENGSHCGWALMTKRNEGRAFVTKIRLPVAGCPRGWDQERPGLADAVHVVLQSDSLIDSQCCALSLGTCNDLAAFPFRGGRRNTENQDRRPCHAGHA